MMKKKRLNFWCGLLLLVSTTVAIPFYGQAQQATDCHTAKDHMAGHSHQACEKAGCSHKEKKPKGSCCSVKTQTSTAIIQVGDMKVADATLIDQHGQSVSFYDLIRGKVVAINFLFTTCTTICPPLGANFVKLQDMMKDHIGKDLVMISISLDPVTDTPERLKEWSRKFDPHPAWTLLTGEKSTVETLLKDLKVFTPLKEDHAPLLLMGKEGENNWIRTNGLADPAKLAEKLSGYIDDGPAVSAPSDQQDLGYFTNVKLVNQFGEEMQLYEDLMKDKVVFINPFFAECTGVCPAMHQSMQQVQAWLGDKLGKEVLMISITVDPTNDTPEILGDYAARFNARKGWYFLSGEQENVNLVLKKFGKYVADREQHDAIILIGNVPTRLWKKANGLAPAEEIIKVLESVINDHG